MNKCRRTKLKIIATVLIPLLCVLAIPGQALLRVYLAVPDPDLTCGGFLYYVAETIQKTFLNTEGVQERYNRYRNVAVKAIEFRSGRRAILRAIYPDRRVIIYSCEQENDYCHTLAFTLGNLNDQRCLKASPRDKSGQADPEDLRSAVALAKAHFSEDLSDFLKAGKP